jgi:hypothetical protein
MTILFFIPMTGIALYDSTSLRNRWLDDFISGPPLDETDSSAARDPEVDGEDAGNGLVISKVPFSELVKVFPNTYEVSSTFALLDCSPGHDRFAVKRNQHCEGNTFGKGTFGDLDQIFGCEEVLVTY